MPWSESRVQDRIKFFEEYATGRWSVTELCRRFSVSRKTAYKFIGRVEKEGLEGLQDRSRAPHSRPRKTNAVIERRIVRAANEWSCWGPRKLRTILMGRHPHVAWPAKSTFGDILKRHGLVKAQPPRRRRSASPKVALATAGAPNDIWAADFKGWRLSGDGRRCEPLVLNDTFSRFCTVCSLVTKPDGETVWPHFERAFRAYGLPTVLRTDNGAPFASRGTASLTGLTVKLIRLGIRPERIEPGKPYQNGCLERFNLTLEIEAMRPRPATWELQQRNLQKFRKRFNEVRPHEALDDRTPADVYRPSARKFPSVIPEFQYPDTMVTRRVRKGGLVKWAGKDVFVGEAARRETIAFQQFSDRHWAIRLGPLELAILDEETNKVLPHDRLVWADEE